jgi:hypothetical protein
VEIWVGVGGEVGIAEMIPEKEWTASLGFCQLNSHSAQLSQKDGENTFHFMPFYA